MQFLLLDGCIRFVKFKCICNPPVYLIFRYILSNLVSCKVMKVYLLLVFFRLLFYGMLFFSNINYFAVSLHLGAYLRVTLYIDFIFCSFNVCFLPIRFWYFIIYFVQVCLCVCAAAQVWRTFKRVASLPGLLSKHLYSLSLIISPKYDFCPVVFFYFFET